VLTPLPFFRRRRLAGRMNKWRSEGSTAWTNVEGMKRRSRVLQGIKRHNSSPVEGTDEAERMSEETPTFSHSPTLSHET